MRKTTITNADIGPNTADTVTIFQEAGSQIKIVPDIYKLGGSGINFPLSDGTMYYALVMITKPTSITKFQYSLGTTGNFTGDNDNAIGIYSITGTTFTKIANTAPNSAGTIWKTAIGVSNLVDLVVPIILEPGKYAFACLYNNSAQTTAPAMYGLGVSYVYQYATGLADGIYFVGYSIAPLTGLPATIESSAFYATSTGIGIFAV